MAGRYPGQFADVLSINPIVDFIAFYHDLMVAPAMTPDASPHVALYPRGIFIVASRKCAAELAHFPWRCGWKFERSLAVPRRTTPHGKFRCITGAGEML